MTSEHERSTSERDRSYWERHARKYDASLRVLAKPLPRMLRLTTEAVEGAEHVLEVAAGTGLVTTAIARVAKDITATDYTVAMIDTLEQRLRAEGITNVRCERADIYALSYPAAQFDAVVAANVLHLLPDLPGALNALLRVLRPGGKLVLPTFCHDETLRSAVVSRVLSITGFPGQRRFTGASLRAAVAGQGLRVTRHEVIGGLIPIGYIEAVRAVP